MENKLESELEVGFNSREVQDNDEEVEITGCTMIKWMEVKIHNRNNTGLILYWFIRGRIITYFLNKIQISKPF